MAFGSQPLAHAFTHLYCYIAFPHLHIYAFYLTPLLWRRLCRQRSPKGCRKIVRKGTPLQAHRKALEQNADYYGMLNAEYRQALDLLFSIPHVHNTTIAEALVKEKISLELEYTPKRPSTSTDRLYFTHRRTAGEDLFFIYNRSPFPFRQQVKLMGKPFRLQLGEEESIILRSSRR